MKVIVMGCGRVGSQVSQLLVDMGHQVTVIDPDPAALARLGTAFKGHLVRGVGFDRDVLIEAGLKTTEAFVATSSSDNANIIAARIAHNIFRVPRVVARLYDPLRAEIYQRLGLTTISTTGWGAERLVEIITHTDLDAIHVFRDGGATLVRVEIPAQLNGHRVAETTVPGEVMAVAITRGDQTFIPIPGTEFQDGDVVYFTVMAASMGRLEQLLGIERNQP